MCPFFMMQSTNTLVFTSQVLGTQWMHWITFSLAVLSMFQTSSWTAVLMPSVAILHSKKSVPLLWWQTTYNIWSSTVIQRNGRTNYDHLWHKAKAWRIFSSDKTLKDPKSDHLNKVMCNSFTATCSDGKPMTGSMIIEKVVLSDYMKITVKYRMTQKKRKPLKNPTKIEEIKEKKFIDRNWTITTCLLRELIQIINVWNVAFCRACNTQRVTQKNGNFWNA